MSDKPARVRNFVTIVYDESAPEGWRNIIANMHIPSFISPCHNKDTNLDGTPKKPHYHVMFMFDSVKTDNQVRALFEEFGGVGLERVENLRSMARYLCHLDEKMNKSGKYVYNISDVQQFGGADYLYVIESVADKYDLIAEMMDFIDDNAIYSYSEFCKYTRQNNRQWFRLLCDNCSYVIKEYMQSKLWTDTKLKN